MKPFIRIFQIGILLFLTSYQAKAQTVLESTLTDKQFIFETWWTKPLDSAYKFVLFNLNTAEYRFDTDQTIFLSYSILSYDLWKGLGPAIGSRIVQDKVVGLGGVQYTYYRKKGFITANFTSELKDNPDFELFSIVQYRPRLSEKLNAFLQGQFSFNFNADEHIFSFQQFRFGVDVGTMQTGLAINHLQFGSEWEYEFQLGGFFRLNFE